jgi:Putative peptidoglycan binding domain
MTKLIFMSAAALAMAGLAAAQSGTDYPPSSDAGSCFARVLIPETTEVVTEQVLATPERVEITVVPAVYETYTQEVMVREATASFTVVPTEYVTQTDQMLETPERIETVVIPAEFETYTEKVMIRPAYTTWKPGAGLYGVNVIAAKADTDSALSTGELLCRVEVPAQYDEVTRTRLVHPERTETKVIPAKYRTLKKEVVKTPARVVEETVPAVFETITLQKMVSPAQEETRVIPATYRTVEKRVVTGGGSVEWREVLCDTNASPAKIVEVQKALTAKGFKVPADGDFGPATYRAMEAYQRANGLPVGYLTVATVESLGVSTD